MIPRPLLVIVIAASSGALSCTRPAPASAPATPAPAPAPAARVDDAVDDADTADRPVLLRLRNSTGLALRHALLRAGSFRTFDDVPPGGESPYQPFRSLATGSALVLETARGFRERVVAPETGVRLEPGRYTWDVRLVGEEIVVDSTLDGPLLPDDARAAFATADRRLTAERAQGWLIVNRDVMKSCAPDPGGPVTVSASLLVSPSGRVGAVRVLPVGGAPASDALAACVRDALKGLRFPAYTGDLEPARSYLVPLAGGWPVAAR